MPRHYRTVTCREVTCGVRFTTASASALYCRECKKDVTNDQNMTSRQKTGKIVRQIVKGKQEEHWISRWKRDRFKEDWNGGK